MSEEAIFLAALDKDPVERAGFLDEACGGDETLRRGVETSVGHLSSEPDPKTRRRRRGPGRSRST